MGINDNDRQTQRVRWNQLILACIASLCQPRRAWKPVCWTPSGITTGTRTPATASLGGCCQVLVLVAAATTEMATDTVTTACIRIQPGQDKWADTVGAGLAALVGLGTDFLPVVAEAEAVAAMAAAVIVSVRVTQ